MKKSLGLFQKILIVFFVPLIFFSTLELMLRVSAWNERLGPDRFEGGLEDHSLFWDPDNVIKIAGDKHRLENEFRGKKVSVKKPEDVYRILCLGGSFTYGWPYNDEPSVAYPAVLESLLNSTFSDRKYEVLNAGIGGYTSYQALFYFKHRLARFQPDLVILCSRANDGNDNFEVGIFCSDKEYYERLRALSKNTLPARMQRCLNNLRIYALLEKIIFNAKRLFIEPQPRVPPADFEKNLEEFITLAKSYDFKLLFMIEPHKNLHILKTEIKYDPYYYTMYALAQDNPEWVRLVDTISLVRKYKDDAIFHDSMHLKPFGHKIVAELILEILGDIKGISLLN